MQKQFLEKIFRTLIQIAKTFDGDVSIGKMVFTLNKGQIGLKWNNKILNLNLTFDPSKVRLFSES